MMIIVSEYYSAVPCMLTQSFILSTSCYIAVIRSIGIYDFVVMHVAYWFNHSSSYIMNKTAE